ncbi:hypothetical protein AB1Y20_010165 [Prymnesium parvum]|uniref:UDENN domain-containing protein n=1 Tax=Prymnesium parvum TaxID=97485 RepID=A0AB34K6M2_PRYPA
MQTDALIARAARPEWEDAALIDIGVNLAAPVCALVVTHFHPQKGNQIEWQHPAAFLSEGVEFKSMPSGAQENETDYVFFRHHGLYGCACFHRLWTGVASERTVRMRSVSAFSARLHVLRRYQEQLAQHVRRLNEFPEDMSPLLGILRSAAADASSEARAALGSSGSHADSSDGTPRLTLPAGRAASGASFSSLTEFLGATLLTVWKAMLLRRRIIFYSPPPIGVACDRAICASLLLSCNTPAALKLFPLRFRPDLLAYVTISDVEGLADSSCGYVACTAEKLVEEKDALWDVFLDSTRLVMDEKDGRALQLTSHDKERFQQLRFADQQARATGDPAVEVFFERMNTQLFEGIQQLQKDGVTELTHELMEKRLAMGAGDGPFLRELFRQIGIRITVKDEGRCCFCGM